MADIPVNANDAVFVATISSNGQTLIDFDFLTFDADDIRAIHQALDGTRTVLEEGVDFTVSGVELPNGGSITLMGGAPVTVIGEEVIIYRSSIIERLADYQKAGDFRAVTVNREMDIIFMIMQELRRDIDRGVFVEIGGSGIVITPGTVGQTVVFDENGNLIPGDYTTGEPTTFATAAQAAAYPIPAGVTLIRLLGYSVPGDGLGGDFTPVDDGSRAISRSTSFVSGVDARQWFLVSDVGFGRINIGAQPGPKGIEYFNTSATRCSTGNFAVDHAALQAGLNSEYAVDIAGQKLQIEDTVVITKQESMLMSSITHQRNGSGDAKRAGNIEVMDNALAVLFDVQTYNTRFDGFRVKCDSANVTTRHFNFTRPTNVSDVDASIKRCVFEYGLSVLRTYGRGLQFNECEVVGTSDMAIELEWNPAWVSNGQSNDQDGTAQRAYTITQIRQHGCLGLVKNVGAFKQSIADILISDIQGDTGGCIFEGVLSHSLINNVQSWMHPVVADQLILHGGSKYSTINNFDFGGFYQAVPLVDRTPNRPFLMTPTDTDPIVGITMSNGKFGPTNTSARITGGGSCDITFDNVQFVDVGMVSSPNEIIFIAASGGTIVDFQLRLKNCRFRAAQDASPPPIIVGGNQNALIKVYRDIMTTQENMNVPWVAPRMTHVYLTPDMPENWNITTINTAAENDASIVEMLARVDTTKRVNGNGQVYPVTALPDMARFKNIAFKVGSIIYTSRDWWRGVTTSKISDSMLYTAWAQDKAYLIENQIRVWAMEKESHTDGTERIVLFTSDDNGASFAAGEYLTPEADGRSVWAAGLWGNDEILIVRVGAGGLDVSPFTYEKWHRTFVFGAGTSDYNKAWTVTPITFPVPGGFAGQPSMVHSWTIGQSGSIVVGAHSGVGAYVLRSTDGGVNWTAFVLEVGGGNEEPTVHYDSASGRYFGFMRNGDALGNPKYWFSGVNDLTTISVHTAPAGTFGANGMQSSPMPFKVVDGRIHAFGSYRSGTLEGLADDELTSAYYLDLPVTFGNVWAQSSAKIYRLGTIPHREVGGASACGVGSVVVVDDKVHLFFGMEERTGTTNGFNRIANIYQTVIPLAERTGIYDFRDQLADSRASGSPLRKLPGNAGWSIYMDDAAGNDPGRVGGCPNFARHATTLTIAAGVLTLTSKHGYYVIDTEAAAAADDLDKINVTGRLIGDCICLQTASASRDVTVKHNSIGGVEGSIFLNGQTDKVLSSGLDNIYLTLSLAGSTKLWKQFSFNDNAV